MPSTRKCKMLALWLCIVGLCVLAGLPISAEGQVQTPETAGTPAYTETLGPLVIGPGELQEYTTVSPAFADNPHLPDTMYPGDLTIQLTGQVIIEDGGTLAIGTLSAFGSEPRPQLTGALAEEARIVVRAGGELRLTGVDILTEGSGVVICQEPGGSVSLVDTALAESQVQWGPPLVVNTYGEPEDLWLDSKTPLTADHLPAELCTEVQYQGRETEQTLALAWDLDAYDGRTTGELEIQGHFLDETHTPMWSIEPLTLTVHWYEPQTLNVTDVRWKGQNACTATLIVHTLPDEADVWGEVSTDGGHTWNRWEDFEILSVGGETPYQKGGPAACVFYLPDATPRDYRVVALDPVENSHWMTASYRLPVEESDDISGDRGGSTAPESPLREPRLTPTPQPASTPLPTEVPAPASSAAPVAAPRHTAAGQAETRQPESRPAPEATPAPSATPEPSPVPEATVQPAAPAEESAPAGLPLAGQIALAVGLGVARALRTRNR